MTVLSRDELLSWPPTVPLWPDAASALGIGRTLTYELAQRGELPVRVLRLGRVMRVPTGDLLAVLGITERDANRPGDSACAPAT